MMEGVWEGVAMDREVWWKCWCLSDWSGGDGDGCKNDYGGGDGCDSDFTGGSGSGDGDINIDDGVSKYSKVVVVVVIVIMMVVMKIVIQVLIAVLILLEGTEARG